MTVVIKALLVPGGRAAQHSWDGEPGLGVWGTGAVTPEQEGPSCRDRVPPHCWGTAVVVGNKWTC